MNFRGYGHRSDHVGETIQVAAVTKPKPPPDQLDDLLRRFMVNMAALAPQEVQAAGELTDHLMVEIRSLEPRPTSDQVKVQLTRLISKGAAPVPFQAPVPRVPTGNTLLRCQVAETQSHQPAAVGSPEPVGFGSYPLGQQTSGPQIRRMAVERNRDGIKCFSCGKSGHAAKVGSCRVRCPNLNESFPFMQPGWGGGRRGLRGGGGGGGFTMILPRELQDRWRTENGD